MDVTKLGPVPGGDDARRVTPVQRSVESRPQGGQSGRTDATSGSTSSSTSASSDTVAPQNEGVRGASGAESGDLRDSTDPRQTRDRAPEASEITTRLRERFSSLAKEARLPTNARLSVEFDGNEPRFRVVNKENGEVIREIPEPEFVELIRRAGGKDALIDDLF